jgi:glycosyltransferase involved in cell wall biosynthesis
LMKAIAQIESTVVLLMVGNGELERDVHRLAAEMPEKFRVLPFQNQSVMPVVYRVGDVFVLPSASETWGLAANEALASGRRILLSDRVGCAPDVVTSPKVGDIFSTFDRSDFGRRLCALFDQKPDRDAILRETQCFDVTSTEETLCSTLNQILRSSF